MNLGPFTIVRLLGRGGMGRVWEAEHPASGLRVALKALSAPRRRPRPWDRDLALASFQREVEAVAAMDHPAIVLVYDFGEVDPMAAAALGLEVGAPWLAMQLCSAGPLDAAPMRGGWAVVKDQLLTVLSALAHAHARDVIHRDLKPANLLLGGPTDVRVGVCVADFGLAWSGGDPADAPAVAGTPAYMPPEQFGARAGAIGPWTDLYATGCVAWELITGAPPFLELDPAALRQAHALAELPPLTPRFAVPAEVEDWLRQLLAKSPADRPPSAAAAAWALSRLGGRELVPTEGRSAARPRSETFSFSTAGIGEVDWPAPAAGPTTREPDRRPFPPSWGHSDPALAPHLLHGAGASLVALRPVPFVGRTAERDALWATLREAVDTRSFRAVIVSGPRGCGRSRLVGWLALRVRELDLAPVVVVQAAEGRGGTDGPEDHVGRWLQRADSRPALLVVDDADADPEVLGAIVHLARLAAVRSVPITLVAVVPADPAPGVADALTALRAEPGVSELVLGELGDEQVVAILRQALGLDPSLADRIAESVGGQAADALALIARCARAGALVATPAGFALDPAHAEALAADPSGKPVALDLLDATPPEGRAAVALLGMLGVRGSLAVWRAACAAAGVPPDLAALQPWVRAGLLRVGADRYRLEPVAHEVILARARADARFARWSKACAEGQLAHYDEPEAPARAGVHLLDAGEPLAATEHFMAQCRRYAAGNAVPIRGLRMMDLWEEAQRAAGLPEDDQAWADGLGNRAAILGNIGQLEAAAELCRDLDRRSAIHGWKMPAVWRAAGQIATKLGRYGEARGYLDRALAADDRDPAVWRALGSLANVEGDFEAALAHALRALELAEATENHYARAAGENDAGVALSVLGRFDEAKVHLERAMSICEEHRTGEPTIGRLNLLDLALHAGEDPRATYREALAVFHESTHTVGLLPIAGAAQLMILCAARVGEWEAWDLGLARCRASRELLAGWTAARRGREAEVPLCTAAELAFAAGEVERARQAWELARTILAMAGDAEGADACAASLAALDASPRAGGVPAS